MSNNIIIVSLRNECHRENLFLTIIFNLIHLNSSNISYIVVFCHSPTIETCLHVIGVIVYRQFWGFFCLFLMLNHRHILDFGPEYFLDVTIPWTCFQLSYVTVQVNLCSSSCVSSVPPPTYHMTHYHLSFCLLYVLFLVLYRLSDVCLLPL